MKYAFVDETGLGEAFANIQKIADACEAQLGEEYAETWQDAPIPVKAYSNLKDVPSDWSIVGFFQDSDDPGALGYHSITPDGRPYAKVFVKDTLDAGFGWFGENGIGTTASHEALEQRRDPGANLWAQSQKGFLRALELGDYVESSSYKKGDVYVSNFLTPRFFEPGSSGDYDYLGTIADPDADPGPGDYEIRLDVTGQAYPVFGKDYPEHKLLAKIHPAARTFKRLRLHLDRHQFNFIPEEHRAGLQKMLRLARAINV